MIKHQNNLSDIRFRERRATLYVTFTFIVTWLLYLSVWYLGLLNFLINESSIYKLITWIGVLLGPLLTLFTRRIVKVWFNKICSSEESQLKDLHLAFVKTLEEVKNKAPYNEAKSLLDRYGPSVGFPVSVENSGMTPQSTPSKQPLSTPLKSTPSKALPQTPTPNFVNPKTPPNVNKFQPQTPDQQQQSQQFQQQSQLQNTDNFRRTWYDRLADAILGDDPSNPLSDDNQKYALICEKCAKHNGLVPREIYIDLSEWQLI